MFINRPASELRQSGCRWAAVHRSWMIKSELYRGSATVVILEDDGGINRQLSRSRNSSNKTLLMLMTLSRRGTARGILILEKFLWYGGVSTAFADRNWVIVSVAVFGQAVAFIGW